MVLFLRGRRQDKWMGHLEPGATAGFCTSSLDWLLQSGMPSAVNPGAVHAGRHSKKPEVFVKQTTDERKSPNINLLKYYPDKLPATLVNQESILLESHLTWSWWSFSVPLLQVVPFISIACNLYMYFLIIKFWRVMTQIFGRTSFYLFRLHAENTPTWDSSN